MADAKPSDYLIVEDPEKPSTWHLQVSVNGKPDHGLMGAAHAALMSPNGYRGNKYEGPGKQEAIDKLKKLYEQEQMDWPESKATRVWNWIAEKVGMRNAAMDQQHLNEAHDHLVAAGAACPGMTKSRRPGILAVTKDASGALRWVTFSSSGYEDRDGEIVATKALEADVARADQDGEYGPLLWWHIPGAVLGQCDFNAMHERILVESGTFVDDRIGAAVAKAAEGLGVSIGFEHPYHEPDANGVYWHARRIERSIMPEPAASNRLTGVVVQETTDMEQMKQAALEALVGADLAGRILAGADNAQKAAEAQGLAYKAAATDKAPAPADAAQPGMADMPMGDGADAGAEVDAEGPSVEIEIPVPTIGNMSPQDFAALIAEALQPLMAQMDVSGKLDSHLASVSQMFAAAVGQNKEMSEKAAQAAAAQVGELTARVKALEGTQPRSLQRARASQSEDNLQLEGSRLKEAQPRDPFAKVVGAVLGE